MDKRLYTYLQERELDLKDHIGLRILLVDDEEDNSFILKRVLERSYKVYVASSGEEGLSLLKTQAVDLMIVDQLMTGIDGMTFCVEAQKLCPDSLRVILTAHSGRKLLLEAIERGNIFRVMLKPWNSREILSMVEEAFEKLAYERAFHDLFLEMEHKNEELADSYKKLKQAQQEKLQVERLATIGKVTAQIMHEINNQLSVMSVLRTMEKSIQKVPELSDYVSFVVEATENLYQMVETLRQFTLGEGLRLNKEHTDLGKLVKRAVHFVKHSPLAEGVSFFEEYDDSLGCYVDCLRIKQVLLNLLRNGIQSIDGEDKQIWIKVERFAQPSKFVISIHDNGGGIPVLIQERLFDAFVSTKDRQGLGLGLEICKRIVEQHKGQIEFDTVIGVGTTFTVTLPLLSE